MKQAYWWVLRVHRTLAKELTLAEDLTSQSTRGVHTYLSVLFTHEKSPMFRVALMPTIVDFLSTANYFHFYSQNLLTNWFVLSIPDYYMHAREACSALINDCLCGFASHLSRCTHCSEWHWCNCYLFLCLMQKIFQPFPCSGHENSVFHPFPQVSPVSQSWHSMQPQGPSPASPRVGQLPMSPGGWGRVSWWWMVQHTSSCRPWQTELPPPIPIYSPLSAVT